MQMYPFRQNLSYVIVSPIDYRTSSELDQFSYVSLTQISILGDDGNGALP